MDRQDVSLFREVLKDLNSASVDAGLNGMELFDRFGYLEMAVDAAQSIDAENSLEKMLAHQMSVCRVMSMKMMAKGIEFTQNYTQDYRHPDMDKAVKLVNASARLVDTFQLGLATIAKIRTGGVKRSLLSMSMVTR